MTSHHHRRCRIRRVAAAEDGLDRNRQAGESKLAMREMGSRYLFIVLYAFLERHLSRGDYRREVTVEPIAPDRGRDEAGLHAVGDDRP